MKKIIQIILFVSLPLWLSAQASSGTTGLLNIPTAAMQMDGTFVMGANYLPENFTPEYFSYNTANYYFNLTFLPFLEVVYRMTFLKMDEYDSRLDSSGKNINQDRSIGLRLRLLKEKKYLPAFVIGGNDIYGTDLLGSLYAVASKTIDFNENRICFTLGGAINDFSNNKSPRPFAGIELSPNFCKQISLIAEYDTHAFNLGSSVLLFNHLYINAFVYDFRNIVGGFAYKIYLKKNKG